MKWLLYGGMSPAAADAVRRHGHEAHELGEMGLPDGASAAEVLAAAHTKQLDVMTADPHLAAVPFERATFFGRSIVCLGVGTGEVEQDDAVDRLFQRYPRLTPGRLYTVTASRVKIRQLPRPTQKSERRTQNAEGNAEVGTGNAERRTESAAEE